jgi:hypothetical protein
MWSGDAAQSHVLLLGPDEPLPKFRARVQRRAEAMRRAKHQLCDVTYVMGNHHAADWSVRQSLLAQLCQEVDPDGQLAVLAPSSARSDVLGCLGDLQMSSARKLQLRAVFIDAPSAA